MKYRMSALCALLLLLGCDRGTTAAAAAAAPPSLLSPADIDLTGAERKELQTGLQPEAWFAERLQARRETVDGQRLNAKIQFLMEKTRGDAPAGKEEMLARFDTPGERAAIRADADRRWTMRTAISADMAQVEDRAIPGRAGTIPVRIYRPQAEDGGPLPVLVYYHGGGFVFSSVKAVDRLVRLIANEAGVVVVSVDYRLAPEHPFPAPQDDAEDAFAWVRGHAAEFGGDPARIGVGGDSAGGQLALSVSLRQRAAQRPMPVYQLLYYPAVTLEQDDRSYELFAQGYGLDLGFIDAVTELAFPDPAARSAPATWAFVEADLRGLPATIVVTAGYDPLRDQGRRLAARLERDGVGVTYLEYPSLTHSFLNWSGVIEDADFAARQTAALFGTAVRSRAAVLELPSVLPR